MSIEIRLLTAGDADVLANVAPNVFDGEVDTRWTAEFLGDESHHLVVALDDACVVGMASAIHYVHPDKGPELWVNEVGVAESHQGRGIGRKLLETLFAHGRALGCSEAWVLTDESNTAARQLYARTGGMESPALMYSFQLGPQR
jgi:GNAT superfamily N-acetyltransferase